MLVERFNWYEVRQRKPIRMLRHSNLFRDFSSSAKKYEIAPLLHRGAAATVFSISVVQFFPYVFSLIAPLELVGMYSLSISYTLLAAIFISFGMDSLVLKAFSNRQDGLPLAAVGLVSTLAVSILYFVTGFIEDAVLNQKFVVTVITPYALVHLISSALQGAGYYGLSTILRRALLPILVLGSAVAVIGVSQQPTYQNTSNIVSVLLSLVALVLIVLISREIINAKRSIDFSLFKNIKTANHLFYFSAFFLLIQVSDRLVISYFLGYEKVGEYTILSGLAGFISVGLIAINTFSPSLFSKERENIQAINEIAFVGSLFATIVAVAAAIVVTLILVAWMSGIEHQSYLAFLFLAAANFINVITGPCGFMCNMTGHEKRSSQAVWVTASINLVLNISLVPFLGILGAAIGTAAAMVFNNLWLSRIAYNSAGMHSSFMYRYF